ncbi:DNA adenine methylase [Clostridium aestuarii]|uniref:DNA adenine methylase n=1 Tax=Clostridium aestuarii TaxID=338193 RepID=A0ABT4D3W1_9CLOT|nr:DNA adenine methylase [Clostridium aestuarii]MCY6485332.1 DNA adenine methylase [Clostridium aestuarii]
MKETLNKETYLGKELNKNSNNLQLNLFEDSDKNTPIRPIHYLGSKLRLLEIINDVIDEVDDTKGTVCDLFAGSGTVSKYLSFYRPVISVDIQEYSRVLCSALLNPNQSKYSVSEFMEMCKSSNHSIRLKKCFDDLEQYEKSCIKRGELGDLEPICDLLDNGSIISYEYGYKDNISMKLSSIMDKCINKMKELNFNKGSQALVVRYFGGLYFSYKQAVEIDCILEQIFNLEDIYIDTYLAALLSTVSDVVNTVGKQFAQPIKARNADGTPKKNILKRVKKDRTIEVFQCYEKWLNIYLSQEKMFKNHKVFKGDYADILEKLDDNVKVVYADPPYTRYHYSRYYHVLETICLRDNPKLSMNVVKGHKKISRGMYREDRHQSPFSIKSKSYDAFNSMFQKVSKINATLILSYSPFDESKKSTPRVLSINQIEQIAKQYFSSIEIVSVGEFSHSKLNKNDKNFEINYNAELLIVCKDSINKGVKND